MRFVIQRVTEATCEVDQKITGQITNGFCVLIGIAETDTKNIADKMIRKLLGMRIFGDENGKTNLSLHDIRHQAFYKAAGFRTDHNDQIQDQRSKLPIQISLGKICVIPIMHIKVSENLFPRKCRRQSCHHQQSSGNRQLPGGHNCIIVVVSYNGSFTCAKLIEYAKGTPRRSRKRQ